MKFAACLLACVTLPVLAQTPSASTQSDLDAKQTALRRHGAETLNRERVRSKANLCAKAGPSDLSYSNCYSAESKVTDANYTEYVRVIGALLGLPSVPTAPPGAPKHLDFDAAEATWLIYRKQSCMAVGGRHFRPGQLSEMLTHGDLGSYQRTGRPLFGSLELNGAFPKIRAVF